MINGVGNEDKEKLGKMKKLVILRFSGSNWT